MVLHCNGRPPTLPILLFFVASLVAPVSAMLRGFGLVFTVEPAQGSEAGYTELHITGAGFGYVSEVRVGGNPCLIHEPSIKNGELTCFSPAGTGSAEVEVIFNTGHRALWRGSTFEYESDATPYISTASQAAPILGNITMTGDFLKVLEGDQQFFQQLNFEKRNATEIMHVYLGSGLELMGAMGGKDEFRCDLIESPSQNELVCEVSGGTPGGLYNLTYILEDAGTGMGYGGSSWQVQGMRKSLYGVDYHVEVVPGVYSLSTQRTGQLGGTRVIVNAEGLDASRGTLDLSRYTVTLDGVPCEVESVFNEDSRDYLTCVTGPITSRPMVLSTPAQHKRAGFWGEMWQYWSGVNLAPRRLMYVNDLPRTHNVMDSVELVSSLGVCSATTYLVSTSSLEDCAESCFRQGSCEYFYFRPDLMECYNCYNGASSITDAASETRRRRNQGWWTSEVGGGVYRLGLTGLELLENNRGGQDVAMFELISKDKLCADPEHWSWPGRRRRWSRLDGASVQACAEVCAMWRADTDGGWCRYFIMEHRKDYEHPTSCFLWTPTPALGTPESGITECGEDELEDRGGTQEGQIYASYALVRPTPHSPQPAGIYPGGRGVHYRVWNACPPNHAMPEGCGNWRHPYAILYASWNSEYAAQTPMYEGVRMDYLRGPWGAEPADNNEPEMMQPLNLHEAGYSNLQSAAGDHGLIMETMGFFVAPFTANYSFMVWSNNYEDMWMSTSPDPSDVVQVAETTTAQCRGTHGRRRSMGRMMCNPFGIPATGGNIASQHRGKLLKEMPGYRTFNSDIKTSTNEVLDLKAEERRFFVRRGAHYGEPINSPVHRRRRSYTSGTAVRIHNPDLSTLSDERKTALQDSWSWPEIVRIEKTREKDGGQWRIGVREDGKVYWSSWITWDANEWHIMDAFNGIRLGSGTTCNADVWWTYSHQAGCTLPCNGDDIGRTHYLMYIWEPRGNLDNLVIEYDNLRSNYYARTISDGSLDDLFLHPIPGSLLEVPAPEPQVKVTSVELPARTALEVEDVEEDENATNTTNDTEWVSPGTSNYVSSDSASGCTPMSSHTAYRYYRLSITGVVDTTLNAMKMAELHFWDTDGNLVDLTSASVTTDLPLAGGSAAANLVDGDTGTSVSGDGTSSVTTAIFVIDLGASNDVAVDMWSYTPDTDGFPNMWTLEGAASNSWPGTMINDQSSFGSPLVDTERTSQIGSFPADAGHASCGEDLSGCEFSQTFEGTVWADDAVTLGDTQVYASWTECQRWCCYTTGCVTAMYETSSQRCTLVKVPLSVGFQSNSGYRVASVLSKGDSMDGYAAKWPQTYWEGAAIAEYPMHTSVTFCKDACDNTQYCNSFQWHAVYGCFLRSACVTDQSVLTREDFNVYTTFYKTEPESCTMLQEFPSDQLMDFLGGVRSTDDNGTTTIPYTLGVQADGGNKFSWNIGGFMKEVVMSEGSTSRRLLRRLTGATESTSTSSSTSTTQSSVSSKSTQSTATSTSTTQSSSSSTSTTRFSLTSSTSTSTSQSSVTSKSTATSTSTTRFSVTSSTSTATTMSTESTSSSTSTSSSSTTSTTRFTATSSTSTSSSMSSPSTTSTSTSTGISSTSSSTSTSTSTTRFSATSSTSTSTTRFSATSSTSTSAFPDSSSTSSSSSTSTGTTAFTVTSSTSTSSSNTQTTSSTSTSTTTSTSTSTMMNITHDIRLVAWSGAVVAQEGTPMNGTGEVMGRLEIYHDGEWGTVCIDAFTDVDAQVACMQLGYNVSYILPTGPPHVFTLEETVPIWMDDVDCDGSEERLSECAFPGFGVENCWHTEDVGLICSFESIAYTGTTTAAGSGPTTTTTTTTWTEATQTPRKGFLRNRFSGKCIRWDTDNEVLELGFCEFHRCDTEQIWELTEEGLLRNDGSYECMNIIGSSQTGDNYVGMGSCYYSANESTTDDWNYRSQKWVYYDSAVGSIEPGYIRNQHSGRCLDVREEWWYSAQVNVDSNARIRWKNCELDIPDATDQTWEFVMPEEAVNRSMSGFFTNIRNYQCLDVAGQTGGQPEGTAVRSFACDYFAVSDSSMTDQIWQLNANGTMQNKLTGLCAVPTAASSGAYIQLASCTSSLAWNLTYYGLMEYGESGYCLVMGAVDGDNAYLAACSSVECTSSNTVDMQWEFQSEDLVFNDLPSTCAARCAAWSSPAWVIQQASSRRRSAPQCQCKAAVTRLETKGLSRLGFLETWEVPEAVPSTMVSVLKDVFMPDVDVSLLTNYSNSTVEGCDSNFSTPTGFCYLSAAEQPTVTAILVNNAAATDARDLCTGDTITLEGYNLDGINTSEVEITIGGIACPLDTLSGTEITCTAPATPHARLNLKVRLGWKGWVDFGPVVNASSSVMRNQVAVTVCDALVEVTSMTPTIGSEFGGTRIKIAGSGFQLVSGLNNVTVMGQTYGAVGTCQVLQSSLSAIECLMPDLDLRANYWPGAVASEVFTVYVNGVSETTSSDPLEFTFDGSAAPRVISVSPPSLSFAVSGKVTINGGGFGNMTRRVTVKFGERSCNVVAVSPTSIECWLPSAAMALPAVCDDIGGPDHGFRNLYNTDCTVQPQLIVRPTVLVSTKGYGIAEAGSELDSRFEIHSVFPDHGSVEGGAYVTVTGTGFSTPAVTSNLLIAALGTTGDYVSWTNTEIVFITRPLTLNVDWVDMMVNLIAADHKCGPNQKRATCIYRAFEVDFTPTVVAVSEPDFGDWSTKDTWNTRTIKARIPDDVEYRTYLRDDPDSQIEVKYADALCNHTDTGGSAVFTLEAGQWFVTITCILPDMEAQSGNIRVRLLPFGYSNFTGSLQAFDIPLVINSVTAPADDGTPSVSQGGAILTLEGRNFASNPRRHFVRVGQAGQFCVPLTVSATELTCRLTPIYQEWQSGANTKNIDVQLWDEEVSMYPLLAFGDTSNQCLKDRNNFGSEGNSDCLSEAECAMRCLLEDGCLSFDYTQKSRQCHLSSSSYQTCTSSDCKETVVTDCRYYEKRTAATAGLPPTIVSDGVSLQVKYKGGLTPTVTMFGLPASRTTTGCDSDGGGLCCTGDCVAGEGYCDEDSDCDGNLLCEAFACSWHYGTTGTSLQGASPDSCCSMKGSQTGFAMDFADPAPLWTSGDKVVLRVTPADGDESYLTSSTVSVSFDDVTCPIDFERQPLSSAVDFECTLGDIPGGLVHFPQVDVDGFGRALPASGALEWIQLPLEVTSITAVNSTGTSPVEGSSLGGGWQILIEGTGFAPAPEEMANSYVEVAMCGRKCEVTSASYTQVQCIVPNVTTVSAAEGLEAETYLPAAKVISRGASAVDVLTPSCFHGKGDQTFEVGSAECTAVFNGDPEITAGINGGDCFIGLDFGEEAAARIEAVRYHPEYDQEGQENFRGIKIQTGVLDDANSCDEFTYGWRGTSYRGCQEMSITNKACVKWDDNAPELVARFPELAGHSQCRNPTPYSNAGIWCYLEDGSTASCSPKMPEITWTTIHEAGLPVMLWNSVEFDSPPTARFVRMYSLNGGGCRLTEVEIIGQVLATAPSGQCQVAVRNVRSAAGPLGQVMVDRPLWRGGGAHLLNTFQEVSSAWMTNAAANVTYSEASTPLVTALEPQNGTQQGGTEVTMSISGFGITWDGSSGTSPVRVWFNTYECAVQSITATELVCITAPRDRGLFPPSVVVSVDGVGYAVIKAGVRWRYLEMWSVPATWTGQELPKEGDSVWIDKGKSLALDTVTPILRLVQVLGELVFDDNQDVELHATYIWVKGGTMEIGTESQPFRHQALVMLHGNKYVEIRLPIIGAKVLAVSNDVFTLRESGDGSLADGDVGTLDIHGAPHIQSWTRLHRSAEVGDTVIVLKDPVDWAPGSEIVLAATHNDGKHIKGEGLHGAPPTHFEDERAYIQAVGSDRKTITLTAGLKYAHRSIGFQRPAEAGGEYIDYSGEVGLITRNVKIMGDEENSERDSWGGHTMVAFGAIYRISNAEFYRMGQTGELSRYPIHFHISGDWGRQCYAYNNSIHHSFQRAVAIHSTNYVEVKHNLGLEIIGHMFFVETGMERMNILEGNIGMGAIPLFSGMLESDQEPAAFWTAAPNNVWRNNIAVTGSDGWYFQLPGNPIAGSIDLFSNTVCPVHDHLGEFHSNRCHHTTGSCVRIYLEYKPTVDPCDKTSGEYPAYFINTTCWGTGAFCFSGKKAGATYNWHMTSVAAGAPDIWQGMMDKQGSFKGGKWEPDNLGIPFVKEGVFVGMFPEDFADDTRLKWKGASIEMPQNENFIVQDSWWYNFRQVPVFMDCSMCWSIPMWRLGGFTYRFSGLHFENSSKRIFVHKKGIYHDMDGSLLGTANSYATWADKYNLGHPGCSVETALFLGNSTPDPTMANPAPFHSSGGLDQITTTIFHVQQGTSLLHSRRDYSFLICTTPIRKLGLHWPEPAEVYGRQLNITNPITGLTQSYEYEKNELTGWAFPVVSDLTIKLRPNLTGLDFQMGTLIWGFNELFMDKEKRADANNEEVEPEWINIIFESWSEWWQYKFLSATTETLAVRHGTAHRQSVMGGARPPAYVPFLEYPATDVLADPSNLPSATHGMTNKTHWSLVFRFPDEKRPPVESHEPYSGQFDARRCPDEGCTIGLPALNQNWTTPKYWSEEYAFVNGRRLDLLSLLTNGGANTCGAGSDPIPDASTCEDAAMAIPNHTYVGTVDDANSPGGCFRYVNGSQIGDVYFNTHATGSSHDDKRMICSLPTPALTIEAEDWIIFDMDEKVTLTNITIFGKLSFDDAADRMLQVQHLIVWGLLEIGTQASPFGALTGARATVLLQGSVLDTETYVYIEEETLHNKVIAVPGRVETYGAPLVDTWLRLASSVSAGAETACVLFGENISWSNGTEIAIAPTEASKDYFSDVELRELTSEPVWNSGSNCWDITWSGGLAKGHFAGDIDVGRGQSVSMRAVVARIDRSVVFDSVTTDGGYYYGGHMEIFDITTVNPARVGSIKLFYTRMSNWGKGGLSAAVKIGYRSEFIGDVIPVNQIIGCSFTDNLEYGIHAQSSNTPLLIRNNTFTHQRDAGIFLEQGSLGAQITGNAILGVKISENHPVMTNEATGGSRVPNYAGIKADEVPVVMINNLVAGSNDIGIYHFADKCSSPRILNNEVFASVMGIFVFSPSGTQCMMVNKAKIWKATHIALMLADITVKNVQLSDIVVADSHLGVMPYFSVGGTYRRLFLNKMTFIGLSEASTWQGCTAYNALPMCRTQSVADMYIQECNSLFSKVDIRQVGFIVPFNTGNKKTCHSFSAYAQCRQFGLPFVNMDDCHFPWEYHDHFDRGVGWSTFTNTTFAYWKTDPCGSGQMGRAVSMGIAGPEVSFPSTFTETYWHDSDTQAKVEANSEVLTGAFSGRRGPCKENGGGCMGLDQFLIQDSDGTFLEIHSNYSHASIVPITPRTQWVWTPNLCSTFYDGVEMDALICPKNVTVELFEMRNLDRGAKDIKWGPLVLTPSGNAPWVYPEYVEDHGFTRGVISSVGPFYGSCPCGWDFSFYHILVKPMVTYYAEAVSLPENFIIRYLSPNPDHSVVLQYFYPDSRGVNVFVGGESSVRMNLRLGRQPVLSDEHGAHAVDAQALRLYITVRGSPEGFTARRDLVIRRSPTVKLKINVEITIPEFTGDTSGSEINSEGISTSFQTNMCILLGIPPNRLKTVANVGSRRLQEGGSSSYTVEVETEITGSSQGQGDTAEGLDAQAQDLSTINDAISATDDDDLVNALQVQGEVTVNERENEASQTVDDDISEESESPDEDDVQTEAEETVDLDDLLGDLETNANAEDCPVTSGASVQVGSITSTAYPSMSLASGESETFDCASVNSGYTGNVTLSCSFGALTASTACTAAGCADAISVTIGGTSSSVTPTSEIVSGLSETVTCSTVNSAYTGSFTLDCLEGNLTADTSGCIAGCLTTDEVNVTVGANTQLWNPSADMLSGESETVDCSTVNSDYEGSVTVGCYYGELTPDLSGCQAKDCEAASTVDITLGGTTTSVALTSTMASGSTGSVACSAANSDWSQDVILSCLFGSVSYSVSNCREDCPTTMAVSVTLGSGAATDVNPTSDLAHGETETLIDCSSVNSGYEGTFSITCDNGTLTADTGSCTELGCTDTSLEVTIESYTGTLTIDEVVASGGTTDAMCEDVSSLLAGSVTLTCEAGSYTVDSSGCSISPCEVWHFGFGEVGGVTGRVYPLEQIAVDSTGVGECGSANEEYSGNVSLSCTLGSISVTDVSECRLTCTWARSNVTVTIDGNDYLAGPNTDRIDHGATGYGDCSASVYGYSGLITMLCDDGVLTVSNIDCTPEPCTTSTELNVTLGGELGTTTPYLTIEHQAEGQGDCNEANELYTGSLNMSCFANTLTLVSDAGCIRSCSTNDSANVTLEGYEYMVYPDFLITTASDQNISCPEGFNGTLMLTCEDGVLTGSNFDCEPLPCPFNSSAYAELNGSGVTFFTDAEFAHLHSWTEPCSTVNSAYLGDITFTCNAMEVRVDQSSCAGPCYAGDQVTVTLLDQDLTLQLADHMDHSDTFTTACSSVNSLFDGDITTTCSLSVLTPDLSGCAQACANGQSATLVVTGGSFDLSLQAQLASGSYTAESCSSALSSSYTGVATLTCDEGNLTATSNCSLDCAAGISAVVTLDSTDYDATTTAVMQHGDQETLTCSSVATGYSGDVVVECNDSSVFIANSTCSADPCPTSVQATFTLDSVSVTISPSSEMASGTTGTELCSSASSDYTGNVEVSCMAGALTMTSNTCVANCKAGDTLSVTIDSQSTTATLSADIADSETETYNCSDLLTGYSGIVEVTCTDGSLSETANTCGADPCLVTDEISITLGSVTGTTYPDSEVADGATGTADCNTANSMYTGTFQISCSAGAITVPANALDSCKESCATSLSVTIDIDSSANIQADVSPSAIIEHGDTGERSCSDYEAGYAGVITLACTDGVLSESSSSCSARNCAGYDGTQVAHSTTWTVSCSDIHPDLTGDINYECVTGTVTRDASGCADATSCLTSGATDLTCSVLGATFGGTGVELTCSGATTAVDISACNQGCQTWMDSEEFQTSAGYYTTNPLASMDHSGQETQDCSDLGSQFTGTMTLTCTDGTVSVVDTCMLECTVNSTTSLTLAVSGDTVDVYPSEAFHDSTTLDMNCSAVDSRYSGSLTLNCSDGTTAIQTESCTPRSCDSGSSVSVSLDGGIAASLSITSLMQHSDTTDVSCGDVEAKYRGLITLTCDYGSVVADTSSCALSTSTSTSTSTSSVTTSSSTSTTMSTTTSTSVSTDSSSTSTTTSVSTESSSTSTTTSVSTTSSTSATSTSVSTESSSTSTATSLSSTSSSTDSSESSRSSSSTSTGTSTSTSASSVSSTSTMTSSSTGSTGNSLTSTTSTSSSPSGGTVTSRSTATSTSTSESTVSTKLTTSTSTSESSVSTASTSTTTSASTASSSSSTSTASSTSTVSTGITQTSTTSTSTSNTLTSSSTSSSSVTASSSSSSTSTSTVSVIADCLTSQTLTIDLAGSSYLLTLNADLQSGFTTVLDCFEVNQLYQNFVTISCDNGVLSADTSGCIESTTATVIESVVALTLSASAGTSETNMNTALQTQESQDALVGSLAESLGVDSARIVIISITVTAVRRRLADVDVPARRSFFMRQLTASTSFNVEVSYEVKADTSAGDTTTIQENMAALDNSSSVAATTFSSALATNFKAAANSTTSSEASSILSSVADEVETSGVTVAVTSQPSVITRTVTTTTAATTDATMPTTMPTQTTGSLMTSPTTRTPEVPIQATSGDDDDSDMLWLNVVAIILGVIAAIGICLGVFYMLVLRPKKAQSDPGTIVTASSVGNANLTRDISNRVPGAGGGGVPVPGSPGSPAAPVPFDSLDQAKESPTPPKEAWSEPNTPASSPAASRASGGVRRDSKKSGASSSSRNRNSGPLDQARAAEMAPAAPVVAEEFHIEEEEHHIPVDVAPKAKLNKTLT